MRLSNWRKAEVPPLDATEAPNGYAIDATRNKLFYLDTTSRDNETCGQTLTCGYFAPTHFRTRSPPYFTVNGFTPSGDVATWTLTAPLGVNKIRSILDDVKVNAGGQTLDGQWIDGTDTMPSGNCPARGDFSYRFDVLPGDGNHQGRWRH
jgi:hypothetical protein